MSNYKSSLRDKIFQYKKIREELAAYCKRDYGYNNCKEDICSFFKGKSIDDIFAHPILIAPNDNFRFIKSRIDNSYLNKGKSSGYRLYYYVNIKKEHVYLIGFYPKIGKYGREDLTNTELKILITLFNNEKKENTLVEHDIENEFSVIIKIG